ncbi:MAG TPA: hypothetical protein VG273_21935 [Bryobacteraceae bacterium]|jgi:hypothetical protein|nr:hypothetical protein [Bryobacteraceae bacterium]
MPTKRYHQTKTTATKKAAAVNTMPTPAPAVRFDAAAAMRAPIHGTEHACSHFEPADLTRTHELIVDAVTAILSTGGHPDDVTTLLHAAMSHTRRRTFEPFDCTAEETGEAITKFIRENFDNWKYDLITGWRKHERLELPAVDPKSITDRIRANTREAVWAHMYSFMSDSSPEEQRFLMDVLRTCDGWHAPAERGEREIYIASAFEIEIGRDRCYIHVPRRLAGKVENYVKALLAVESKDVA